MSVQVTVELRGTRVGPDVELRDEDPPFLGLERAPPVGAVLGVKADGAEPRAFEVRGRVEGGVVGVWVDVGRLETTFRVGSEHLTAQSESMGSAAPVAFTDEPTGVVMGEPDQG